MGLSAGFLIADGLFNFYQSQFRIHLLCLQYAIEQTTDTVIRFRLEQTSYTRGDCGCGQSGGQACIPFEYWKTNQPGGWEGSFLGENYADSGISFYDDFLFRY